VEFELRPALAQDRERILAISSQVWEGEDYVPSVIDDWLAARDGELVVALLEGQLVAFAHLAWLLPGYAWFEGVRTDPAYRNKGAAKAITEYLLDRAARASAKSVGLSTYVDNSASIRIAETHGFTRTAGFVYQEATRDSAAWSFARAADHVEAVSPAVAEEFMASSPFLAAAHGHLPHGWKFYPFALGPQVALAGMQRILGLRDGGRVEALLCSARPRASGEFSVDFLDGDPLGCEVLLRHALNLASDRRSMWAMVPKWGAEAAPALDVFRKLDFHAWYNGDEDVLLYERGL
jgi:GNAT superfamily N-acetyltransferase